MSGWYKQQRNLPDRAWFKEAALVQLYVTLKSLAYVTDGRYQGTIIRRGSCPTTRADLMDITGLSARTLDRCLKKLVDYNEIIVKGNNRFSMITICDYDGLELDNSLFGEADGIANGIAGGTTDGIAGGTTHLSTIEYKKEDNLITPYSPYKMERETRGVALEVKKRYNKVFDGILQPCIRLTMPTQTMVEECIRRFGMQAIDLVFEQVKAEPFSLGINKTGFVANFQYIFKPNNFQQYLERAQLRQQKKDAPQPQQGVGVISEQAEVQNKMPKEQYEKMMREAAAQGNKYAIKIVEQWDRQIETV